MFSKIASVTLPIPNLVLVGFFYSRRVKPDLGGGNKLIVVVALPVLIFISLSVKSVNPIAALSFTGASFVLILLSGLIAWPLAKFSGATRQAFLPCAKFTNVGPIGFPLITLAYGPEGMATVLGVASSQLQWVLPAWVQTSCSMIGSVLVPMMLMSLGARLADSQVADVCMFTPRSLHFHAY